MGQFVHGRVRANPAIIWRSKGSTGWRFIFCWRSDPGPAGSLLKHFPWTSPPWWGFPFSALAAKGVPRWVTPARSARLWETHCLRSPAEGKDRQHQADCRDRQWGMETRVWETASQPREKSQLQTLSQFGLGMEDAALKRGRLPCRAR